MNNDYGFEQLQKHLLEILIDIDRVCRENNIKYSLFAGTLLGAIRHKGFIPWDDDADICFERTEFEKFVKVYPLKKDEKFILEAALNKCTLAVINPDPSLLGVENKMNLPGPWVTLFIFDNTPENPIQAKLKIFLVKMLMGMMGKPLIYNLFRLKTKILCSITSFMGVFFSKNLILEKHITLSKWKNKKTTKCISVYNNASPLIHKKYPRQVFNDYIEKEFEGVKLMAMSGFHEFLKITYGDYMTPLPESKRIPRHL